MQKTPLAKLHAHLRGALNTGRAETTVDEVIAIVEDDLTMDRALKALEMWADVENEASMRRDRCSSIGQWCTSQPGPVASGSLLISS